MFLKEIGKKGLMENQIFQHNATSKDHLGNIPKHHIEPTVELIPKPVILIGDTEPSPAKVDPLFAEPSAKGDPWTKKIGAERTEDMKRVGSASHPEGDDSKNIKFVEPSKIYEAEELEAAKIDDAPGFAHDLQGSTLMTRLSKPDDGSDVKHSDGCDKILTEDGVKNELPASLWNSSSSARHTDTETLDEDRVQKAIAAYMHGSRLIDAAKRNNISASAIYGKLQSMHPSKKRSSELDEATLSAITDYKSGYSLRGASTRNGISDSTLRYRLKRKYIASATNISQPALQKVSENGNAGLRSSKRKASIKSRQDGNGDGLEMSLFRNGADDDSIYKHQEPVKKKMRSVRWSAKDMQNALRDVKGGLKISIASKIYQIPSSTIRDRVKGRCRSKFFNKRCGRSKSILPLWTTVADSACGQMGGKPGVTALSSCIGVQKTLSGKVKFVGKRKPLATEPISPSKEARGQFSTEDDIEKALNYVSRGTCISIAAAKYGVPYSKLYRRVEKRRKEQIHTTNCKVQQVLNSTKGFRRGYSRNATEHSCRFNHFGNARRKWTEEGMTKAIKEMQNGSLPTHAAEGHCIPRGTLHSRISKTSFTSNEGIGKPRWTEEGMRKAIEEVENGSLPSHAAKKYGIPSGTLSSRIAKVKKKQQGMKWHDLFQKNLWRQEHENQLANYIDRLSSHGFIPANDDELLEMVKDFVQVEHFDRCFENSPLDRSWLDEFLRRNKSGMRMTRMMKSNQKTESGYSNPFIVYNFYDALEKIASERRLESNRIWTCCEAGFPCDPHKVERRIKFHAGEESCTACLITCSSAGEYMDPYIIHREEVDDSLRNHASLPGTSSAASKTGCLTATVFDQWFDCFLNTTKRKPSLLIVDSQLTYISVQTMQKAATENIFLMKLPCNTSCVLQPLWRFCFTEFATQWKSTLVEWLKNHKDIALTKDHFTERLCSIWNDSLSPENIIAGFESTGIFPVNRAKFPTNRLDQGLLRLHTVWLAAGKPEHMAPDVPSFFNPFFNEPGISRPSKRATRSAFQPVPLDILGDDCKVSLPVVGSAPKRRIHTKTSRPTPEPTSDSLFPVCWCRSPPAPVPGKKWVPTWTLLDDAGSSSENSRNAAR